MPTPGRCAAYVLIFLSMPWRGAISGGPRGANPSTFACPCTAGSHFLHFAEKNTLPAGPTAPLRGAYKPGISWARWSTPREFLRTKIFSNNFG